MGIQYCVTFRIVWRTKKTGGGSLHNRPLEEHIPVGGPDVEDPALRREEGLMRLNRPPEPPRNRAPT